MMTTDTVGVIGVAAGATVVAVKVLNSAGSGTNSGVIAGVNYVKTYGVAGDVANMSLGGGISTALDNAVFSASAKVKFCLAAGNSSANANNSSPARVNGANIYTISAFGQGDVFAYFSNYGNPPIDYSEPGVSIYSTYKSGGYATLSGTSMATPHAAGILLLGAISSTKTVTGDPDGNPDKIGIH
jgi:subtilisin family serine protease